MSALLVCLACSGGNRAPGSPLANGGSGSKSIAASTSGSGGDGALAGEGGAIPQDESPAGGRDDAGGANGAAGDGTTGNGATGNGAAGDDSAGAGNPPWMEPEHEPVCTASSALTTPKKLAISSPDADQLGGISSDERVIAWTVVAGEQVTLHYAQRASAQAEFAAAEALVIPAASDSVSLSADGLRLVYVNVDRKGFSQLVRTSTEVPFELLDSRDFALVQESTALFAVDEYVGDPVLAPDDLGFIYSRYGAGRRSTLLLSERFSPYAPWPEGSSLAVTPKLEATDAGRQRPTGVSRDLESLFLWDSASSSQRVAVLAHDTRQYDLSQELGDARGASPNSACSRVYYDAAGDLWTADFGAAP